MAAYEPLLLGEMERLGFRLSVAGAAVPVPTGGRAFSAAALAAAKLLTIRLEKGSKDKLQALLLIDENRSDERFLSDRRALLDRFERDRVEDAVADVQAAFLSLSADPLRSDPQTSGYGGLEKALERGLALLHRLLGIGEAR